MKLEEEILISAYLDGELAGEEQQRVEKLLAASDEARQLADEMRAVRNRLQSLPRLGLPADFAAQTVRRAEQELAVANAVDAAVGDSVAPTRGQSNLAAGSSAPSNWASWRMYAWAAVALAAGVMIMLNNRPAQQEIAYQQSAGDRPHTTGQAAPDASAKDTTGTGIVKSAPPERSNQLATDRATPHAGSTTEQMNQPYAATGQPPTQFSVPPVPKGATTLDGSDSGISEYAVVTLDVTRPAADEVKFKQLLKMHEVDVRDHAAEEGPQAKASRGTATPPTGKILQRWVRKSDATGTTDVAYLVEVSQQQLEGAVADLRANTEWCRDVAVLETVNDKQPESPRLDRTQKLEATKRTGKLIHDGKRDEAQEAPKAIPAPGPPPTPAPAPAAELPPAAGDREGPSGLLEPKPSENDPPADGRLPPAAVKAPRGTEKTAEPPPAKPTDPAEPPAVGAVAPPDDKAGLRAGAAKAPQVRVLFVLRTVEPTPAAAAPVSPAPSK